MHTTKGIITAAFILLTVFVSGCTALQPFPNIARGGDTIALAVGSPKDMTRANTTATFISDVDASVVDITSNIRSIFKLYADQTSRVYEFGSNTGSLVNSSSHSPWITIVAVDMPQGLTVGTGVIRLNTTATYPSIGSHINDIDIAIEVIPGTGTAHSFPYEFGIGSQNNGDLAVLEPLPTASYGPSIPSSTCPCPDYAAIEIKTTIPTSLGSLYEPLLRIIPADLTVDTGSGRNVTHGTVNNDLTVIFTSQDGTLKYQEAQFDVVLHSATSFTALPTITSVRYFDINGNEVSGPVSDYNVALK